FGMTGPRSTEGAYDWTVQELAGWQTVTGDPDGPPTKSGLSLAVYCGGYVAAIAILGAVWRARRDGTGGDVDLSLFEVALAQLAYLGTWVASRGYRPIRRPNSAHQSMIPFQNFETRDGWLVVACPKQRLWERLCEAVNDVSAALADVQVAAREAIVELDHPVLGAVREVASPLRLDGYDPPVSRGPLRGEHTADVLRELCGYSDDEIGRLARDRVFGDVPLPDEVPA